MGVSGTVHGPKKQNKANREPRISKFHFSLQFQMPDDQYLKYRSYLVLTQRKKVVNCGRVLQCLTKQLEKAERKGKLQIATYRLSSFLFDAFKIFIRLPDGSKLKITRQVSN